MPFDASISDEYWKRKEMEDSLTMTKCFFFHNAFKTIQNCYFLYLDNHPILYHNISVWMIINKEYGNAPDNVRI